jgi:hypothetical protein
MTACLSCVDCGILSPEADTNYTLIDVGWRLTRTQGPDGAVIPEWRCPVCWRVYKSGDSAPASRVAAPWKPASGTHGVSSEAAEDDPTLVTGEPRPGGGRERSRPR